MNAFLQQIFSFYYFTYIQTSFHNYAKILITLRMNLFMVQLVQKAVYCIRVFWSDQDPVLDSQIYYQTLSEFSKEKKIKLLIGSKPDPIRIKKPGSESETLLVKNKLPRALQRKLEDKINKTPPALYKICQNCGHGRIQGGGQFHTK